MGNKTAKLTIGNESWDFDVLDGTTGPQVIDISSLYQKTGRFTYDPGFTSTASCASSITFIDGDKGILLYRGYPIDELAEKKTFLEVAYLLLYGELPTPEQKEDFELSRHPPHDDPRADDALLHRLSPRRASDGGRCAGWSARCRPSITTPPTSTIPTSGWSPRSA